MARAFRMRIRRISETCTLRRKEAVMRNAAIAIGACSLILSAWTEPSFAQSLGARIQSANEQLLNRGDLSILADLLAPGYVAHVQGLDLRGPNSIGQFVSELRTAFP